jgi:hypothetical protein
MKTPRIAAALLTTTLTATALLLPSSPASAANIKVNFDGGTPGAPCAFAATTPLRDKYAGLGIRFKGQNALDGGAILDDCSFFGVAPRSGLRFLAFNESLTMANGGVPTGPQRIVFDTKKQLVKIYVSKGSGAGTAQFTLLGKRGGTTVRRATVVTSTPDWSLLNVKAARGIKSAVLKADTPSGYWVADDLVVR